MNQGNSLIGNVADHFEILSELGRGGMGVVYAARDLELDRTVALKFLSKGIFADAALVARFEREGRAAAKLKHPNIVTIFSVGHYEDMPFIVMEYVEGHSLAALIAARGRQGLARALDITRQAARGLSEAHRQGIVHRDIKPHNIAVDATGLVKIMDFGLAKRLQESSEFTQPGTVLGTPAYMSPEHCASHEVGPQSDIYSLGVVLFEMLTGTRPYASDTPVGMMKAILEQPFPKLRTFDPRIPERVDKILAGMTDRDLHRRYSSAAELIKDLDAWLLDTPRHSDCTDSVRSPDATTVAVENQQPGRLSPSRTCAGQPRRLRTALLTAVALLVAAVCLVLVMGRGKTQPEHAGGRSAVVAPNLASSGEKESYDVFRHLRTSLEESLRGITDVKILPSHLTPDEFVSFYHDFSRTSAIVSDNTSRLFTMTPDLMIESKFTVTRLKSENIDAALYRIMVNPRLLDTTTQTLSSIQGWNDVKLRLVEQERLVGLEDELEWLTLTASFELIRFLQNAGALSLVEPQLQTLWTNMLRQMAGLLEVSESGAVLLAEAEALLSDTSPAEPLREADVEEFFERCCAIRSTTYSAQAIEECLERDLKSRTVPYTRISRI